LDASEELEPELVPQEGQQRTEHDEQEPLHGGSNEAEPLRLAAKAGACTI
jgi:hypothetical protein